MLQSCKALDKRDCEVTVLPVDGRSLIDPADVRRALRPKTKLISVMMANNETGALQPVEEIGKIAAEAAIGQGTGRLSRCFVDLFYFCHLRT